MSSCRLVFGLRARCDVMQCTARVFGSCLLDGAMHMCECPLVPLPRPLFRGGVQTWRTQKGREGQG